MHPLRERILSGSICSCLRTKAMFVAGHDGEPGADPLESSGAIYWCNLSGWSMGPDFLPANPRRCVPGRDCFSREIEA
jgi:hypothetical protein